MRTVLRAGIGIWAVRSRVSGTCIRTWTKVMDLAAWFALDLGTYPYLGSWVGT